MSDIGIIAIGRNEGERLRGCLASALAGGCTVVYVDSNSTDGSAALARQMGAQVVDLDMSLPFSAARARNAGFQRLLELAPAVRYAQFVDGDCQVVPGWIEQARAALDSRDDVAVVCGRRRERFPEESVYNLIADIEWNTPAGETKSCGGDAMMRAAAFAQATGFDPTIVAGEEPELCQRLRAAGWKILRLDAPMTLHDSAMLHFRQWWKRAVRSGYGAADVATRFGSQGLFVAQVRSARTWVYGWPLLMVAVALAMLPWAGPKWAIAALGIIALALPAQMLRTAARNRRRATSWADAIAYGILTMLGKWANVIGQLQYARDRRAGKHARLIEYKTAVVIKAAGTD
ncbi:MAG TPA: glycosyltransferase [Tepidisphaeraceae bacterium]|nr:glycosyltransferase [Tepidisphaeraceae bacterium]